MNFKVNLMEKNQDELKALVEIRDMMQRSSRFISLSGLSGVFSGLFALIGAALAYWKTQSSSWLIRAEDTEFGTGQIVRIDWSVVIFLLIDAIAVLILSILVSYYLTSRKARKKQQPIWGPYSRQLLVNLSIPLLTGGVFCIILFSHSLIAFIAPSTLIFYGLALINAGKYAFEEISYLGITEILIGLIALLFLGKGLIFWAIGFGLVHIIYGILMYIRHDR